MAVSEAGTWRLRQGLAVALAATLAFAAAWLVLALLEGAGAYTRFDWTRSRRNTVDQALAELLDGPGAAGETVTIDTFFRPLPPPYDALSNEAEQRTFDLVLTAVQARRDVLELVRHDLSDLGRVRARQAELGVEGAQILVVSCGERRAVLRLFGDVVRVDWGNPTPDGLRALRTSGIVDPVDPRAFDPRPEAYREARVTEFRGAEALATAILRATRGEPAQVAFLVGHGGPEPGEGGELEALALLLSTEGYGLSTWDGSGPLSEDVDVLLALGPELPLRDDERERIDAWVEAGGALLAAPGLDEVMEERPHGVADYLRTYGMDARPGIACQSVTGLDGAPTQGVVQCSELRVRAESLNASHPLTEPLRRAGASTYFAGAPVFERGSARPGALLIALVNTPRDAWIDERDENGRIDFRFDRATERRGAFPLVMLSTGAGRVIGLSSADVATNDFVPYDRALLLACIGHLAERGDEVRIPPRDPRVSLLDLRRGSARPLLFGVVVAGLPGLTALVGAFVLWRRRRP